MMKVSSLTPFVLAAVASATSSIFPRNNPPQPPCVYPYTKFVYSGCFVDSVASRALPFMTELEFNNATVEQCTAYCKGNNYRYAGLEYHGQCFCGTSVSSQAVSEAECNLPCNGDSSQVCGGQDRLSVYQDPTFLDADDIAISSDYLSLGCYTEGTSGRSLDYSQWDYLNISAMTTETCLTACGNKGFPFAGTEFGRECYCGVVLGNGTLPTDAGQCSTQCAGNGTQTCGGPDHLSLYVAKNLESTDPCGPPVISSSVTTLTPTPTSSTPTSSTSAKTTSTPTSSSTTRCAGYCPITTSLKPPTTSSSKTSTSTPKSSATKCVGHYCPITTPVKPTTSTHKPSTSTSKISTVKCSGYHCASSTTLRTTTTPTPTPTPTLKPTLPPCVGILCWPPPGNPSTSCFLGLFCPPETTKSSSKEASSVKSTTSQKTSSTKKSTSTVQEYPTVIRPTHY